MSCTNSNVLALGALDARVADVFLSCHLANHLYLFFLPPICLRGPLRVRAFGVGALTANGQATTMTQATVATDLHKAVDVLANFTMEVAFSGDRLPVI